MIPISDILIRSISGYVFMVPVFVLYFLWLKKLGRTQSFLHTAAVFVFGYYLFGLLPVTGIGFTSTMTFRPNISWTPFIGMITGPIDTILNIILFVPLGFFLPLLYKKYHHMKTVALTGFLFSLAVEIVQLFGNFNPAVSMLWLKYFSLLFAHLPLWSRLRLGLSMMC